MESFSGAVAAACDAASATWLAVSLRQKLQDSARQHVRDEDERRQDPHQRTDRRDVKERHFLRLDRSQGLRGQFTEHQHQQRQNSGCDAGRIDRYSRAEVLLQHLRGKKSRQGRCRQVHHVVADQDGAQKFRRLLRNAEQSLRLFISFFRQRPQTDLIYRHDGGLRRREKRR